MNVINNFFSIINDYKELFISILGWSLAVFQFIFHFFMNRTYKKLDRKFEAYSGYMVKIDKIMNNVSNNPNILLNLNSEFLRTVLNNTDDEIAINDSLIKYNERIKDFVLNATEPLMIIRQELNQLKLICSKELLAKIVELDKLAIDYNNAVKINLAASIPNNINSTVNKLQTLTQDERWHSFEILNNDILTIMRKEIGNK